MAAALESPEFYMRPLKPPCVSFLAPESKPRLIRALSCGTGEAYMPLSSQFRTQDDPAFCGISSLVMSLNALKIDPGRRWKGNSVWRWFEESMLSCCEPLETVRTRGISLDSLACLARCQGAGVSVLRPAAAGSDAVAHPCTGVAGDASELTAGAAAIDDAFARPSGPLGVAGFRRILIAACSTPSCIMVASFNRRALGQTGGGHFSPVAAYDHETDSALILDVARFKLPPFWVPVHNLHAAMCDVDPDTGLSRGCLLLRRLASAPVLFATIEDLLQGVAPSKPCCGAAVTASPVDVPPEGRSGGRGGSASCLSGAMLAVVRGLVERAVAGLAAVNGAVPMEAGLPGALARAFEAVAPAGEDSGRCYRRVSADQVIDAEALLADMRAWGPFSAVREALSMPKADAVDGRRGCEECVVVDRSHMVTLLLATFSAAARRAVEAGGGTAVPCPSCASARTLGLATSSVPGSGGLPGLGAFAAVPLPAPGSVLLREATLLSEQVLAVSADSPA